MKPQPYRGRQVVLPTLHAKSQAIAPAFAERLGAQVVEHPCDTDRFGTFSGEVTREGTALDAARRKVAQAFADTDAELALASEGSFGPHPETGFIPAGQELLHFADRARDFALTVSLTTAETNYRMAEVDSLDALTEFAQRARFPSHALILATGPRDAQRRILKGIRDETALAQAFANLQRESGETAVWVETDMRASHNPTRMAAIAQLAQTLATRLDTPCPACGLPGWGQVDALTGLPCAWCGTPTRLVHSVVHGCVKCGHSERRERPDGRATADPGHCPECNP